MSVINTNISSLKGQTHLSRSRSGLTTAMERPYYPSNVITGTNLSVVALTDGDGFNNDGVPHTRLQIRENGEDFRLRTPSNPLAAIDRALGMVDAKRSYLGAMENRLASVIDANTITDINLSSAHSLWMTRAQILQQAGTSVLAQANQTPEGALALLGG